MIEEKLIKVRFKPGTNGSRVFAKENESNSLVSVLGAITTEERFHDFDESLCHLMDDGRIMRYGVVIGSREDLEFL